MSDVEVYTEEDLRRGWWMLLVLGILAIGFGALLIFWPGRTLTVVTTVVGLFMIVAGVIRFFVAVFASGADGRWLMAVAGIVGVVIGVVIMRNPESTITLIALLTAIFWIISGMVDFFRGITDESLPDRGTRIAFGALTVIFGIVILAWPDITIGVFAVLMGVSILFVGVLEVVAAFQVRNA